MSDITQGLLQDEFVLVKPSALSDLIKSSVTASFEEIYRKFSQSSKPDRAEEEDFMDVEGCEFLNVAKPTFYRYLSKRTFASYKRGKKVYVLRSELIAFLKSGKRRSESEIVSQHLKK